jgi:5-oxoprolinase (ATP-hydrolysing) subunit C
MRPVKLPPGTFAFEPEKPSRRRFGVPPGGPFDSESFRVSRLLTTDQMETTFEIGYFGGDFQFEEPGTMIISGASRPVRIDDLEVAPNSVQPVTEGTLTIGIAQTGVRSYVTFHPTSAWYGPRTLEQPTSLSVKPLRVVVGPQGHAVDIEAFLRANHASTTLLDRVGLRLKTTFHSERIREYPSEPQCVGSIQLTPDGTPIIIGPDGPTLGGYPKIAIVISADLDRVGQIAPVQSLKFELVTIHQARKLREDKMRSQERSLKQLAVLLREPAF